MKKFLLSVAFMTGVISCGEGMASSRKTKDLSSAHPKSPAAAAARKTLPNVGEATDKEESDCGAGCSYRSLTEDPYTFISRHYPMPGETSYPFFDSEPEPIETSWPVVTFWGGGEQSYPTDLPAAASYGGYGRPSALEEEGRNAEAAHRNLEKGLFGYVITQATNNPEWMSTEEYTSSRSLFSQIESAGPAALTLHKKACTAAYNQLQKHLKNCENLPISAKKLLPYRQKLVNRVNNFDSKCYPFIVDFRDRTYSWPSHSNLSRSSYMDIRKYRDYVHFIEAVNGQVELNNKQIFETKILPLKKAFSTWKGSIDRASSEIARLATNILGV